MKEIIVHNPSDLKTAELDKFIELQGNLKEMSKDNYEKFKELIITEGFSFPNFVWDNEGTLYVIDGHGRNRVLKNLREEGYFIPPLPYVLITCRDKDDAKKKLLAYNSKFGKMTYEGMDEFLEMSAIEIDEMVNKFELPDVKLYFKDLDKNNSSESKTDREIKQDKEVDIKFECPCCNKTLIYNTRRKTIRHEVEPE